MLIPDPLGAPITCSGPGAIEQARLFEFGVQHIAADIQKARSLQLIIPAVVKGGAEKCEGVYSSYTQLKTGCDRSPRN